MLTAALDPATFRECLTHLDALAALRKRPQQRHRSDVIGRLSLLFSQLGQAVARTDQSLDEAAVHPAAGHVMRLLEADLVRQWTLAELADEVHLTPGHMVRLFKGPLA